MFSRVHGVNATGKTVLRHTLKRRQAIEPVIGHLKADGLLVRLRT